MRLAASYPSTGVGSRQPFPDRSQFYRISDFRKNKFVCRKEAPDVDKPENIIYNQYRLAVANKFYQHFVSIR